MKTAALRTWQTACQGKVSFPTYKRAAKSINRRKRRLPLQPYLCKGCHNWHVGNRP